jgi:spermidine dehydrogenase
MKRHKDGSSKGDHFLGMDNRITRRDFLNGMLLGTGLALLDLPAPLQLLAQTEGWYGYGGVGDYAGSHGNTEEVIKEFHKIRDGKYSNVKDIVDTGEVYDLVVIGGGLSGMGAAYEFKKNKRKGKKCLILENHPLFGGQAKRNEFNVNGHKIIGPQASNAFVVINKKGYPGYDIFSELKVPKSFQYSELPRDMKQLHIDTTSYGFMLWHDISPSVGIYLEDSKGKGRWLRDPWGKKLKGTDYSDKVRQDFDTWRNSTKKHYWFADFKRWLDRMTYQDYLEKVMGLSHEVSEFAHPIIASGLGLGCDAISAYAAYQIGMPGFQGFVYRESRRRLEDSNWHSFPGGNDGFSRYIIKALIPGAIAGSNEFGDILNQRINFDALDNPNSDTRLRLESTVVSVRHESSPARSDYVIVTYAKGGKLHRLRTRGLVASSAGWMAPRIVKDLPGDIREAFTKFHHSSVMVVNVALTNWRFLYKLGVSGCRWFDGFGFSCNIRKPMIVGDYRAPLHPDKPIVLTFYVPFLYPGLPIEEQGKRGRKAILTTGYGDFERQIKEHMVRVFGSAGFDARKDIAGIVLNRWVYAYLNPQPGYYFGRNNTLSPREVVRKGYGRIAFSHSELDGHQNWTGAVSEGKRAALQILDIL